VINSLESLTSSCNHLKTSAYTMILSMYDSSQFSQMFAIILVVKWLRILLVVILATSILLLMLMSFDSLDGAEYREKQFIYE